MLRFNKKLSRVELLHHHFATHRDVERLKKKLAGEKERFGASRAVLRVLTERPVGDDRFMLEGTLRTRRGEIAVFGFNDDSRLPKAGTIEHEMAYLRQITDALRRRVPPNPGIVRLQPESKTSEELQSLYATTYIDYPVPLDANHIMERLRDSIGYAVLECGKIVSVLFGETQKFGDVHAVELTHSATKASKRGIGMTVALAMKIKEEAEHCFADVAVFAETIAGPVMRSCHDFGMSFHGLLREHSRISIGERTFTNFYLWSL